MGVSLLLGHRAGRYLVRKIIGRGSMSTVFLGEHVELGHEAAIKVLTPHLACNAATAERVRAEARTAARLAHRTMVKILDVGDLDDGVPYCVMELLQGRPLDRALAGTLPVTPEKAYALVKQVCGALEVIHDHGEVHRGIRPSNVYLSAGEPARVKLLGFGAASIRGAGLHTSGPGKEAERERSLFLSPEQAAGQGDVVSPRTDIYALGALIYWMLTGRAPLEGKAELADQRVNAPVRELKALRPDIADSLSELVSRCLQLRPSDRPRTVKEVAFIFGSSVQMTVEELESRVQDVICAVLNNGGDREAALNSPDLPARKDDQKQDTAESNDLLRQQKSRSGDAPRVDLPAPMDEASLRAAEEAGEAAEGVIAREGLPAPRPVPAGPAPPDEAGGTRLLPDDQEPTDELPARDAPDAGVDSTPVAPCLPEEPETVLKTNVVAADELVSHEELQHKPRTDVQPVEQLVASGKLLRISSQPAAAPKPAGPSAPDDADDTLEDEVISVPGPEQDTDDGARGVRLRRYKLRVVEGPDTGLEQSLKVGTVIIGTSSDNDLELTDPTISRNHLEIQVRARGILVNDLDSSNGTFLDDRRLAREVIRGPARLRLGGDTVIELIPVDG